jgi:urease accessory protein
MFRDDINQGEAQLHVASVAGCSTVLTSRARTPFRLLTPRARGDSVWAYTTSFGGGMVAGDRTKLQVALDPGTRCFLGTQSSTKIYRNPACLPCSHELEATVSDNALLALVADPVQCFADSTYEQRQQFTLSPTADLVLLDWLSAGRAARGERWSFRRYVSRNRIERNGRAILHDAVRLDNADGALHSKYRGGQFNCLATLVLLGQRVAPHAAKLLEWCAAQPIRPGMDILFAASPLHEGAILRVAGPGVERVAQVLREHLTFLRDMLHDDPLTRKW